MTNSSSNDSVIDRFPVAVVMAREEVTVGQWRVPRWRVEGVVAGSPSGAEGAGRGRLIHTGKELQQYLWSGFDICLYRDSSESYWLNLVGQQPSLFVVCREDQADGTCVPLLVTANYDEAGAYMEADGTVMAAPIPPEVYRWLEAYVMENFRPAEGKSRKRQAWFDNEAEPRLPPRGGRQRSRSGA